MFYAQSTIKTEQTHPKRRGLSENSNIYKNTTGISRKKKKKKEKKKKIKDKLEQGRIAPSSRSVLTVR